MENRSTLRDNNHAPRRCGWLLCIVAAAAVLPCSADADLPDHTTEASLRENGVVVEQVAGPTRGLLVTETRDGGGRWKEPSSGRVFAFRLDIYLSSVGAMDRRFRVHAPDGSLAPFATKTGRLLALLWGIADQRAARLATRLRGGVVDVWLCRDGEAGGQQSQTSLFVYDVLAERTGIEWVRTITHEYGHFLLPGASGYLDPEPWSNGVLGERMFIGWLRDALGQSVLRLEDVPFASRAELDDYCAKQVDPLIERIARAGPDESTISGVGRKAMDELCALLLFADRVHGARAVFDSLVYLAPSGKQPRGIDFLRAYQRMIEQAEAFDFRIPVANRSDVYLPKGVWRMMSSDVARGVESIEMCTVGPDEAGNRTVSVASNGWRTVRYKVPRGALLRFERR